MVDNREDIMVYKSLTTTIVALTLNKHLKKHVIGFTRRKVNGVNDYLLT